MSIRRDTAYNLLGNGVPLLAAAATIPFTLSRLGDERFGILTLLWALIGYFGLFDLGVGRALTYEVSRASRDAAGEAISRSIQAGLVLTVLTGAAGSLLVLLLAPGGGAWFKISPALRAEASAAFAIVALAIVPTTITSGLRGALEGLGRFAQSNVTRVALGTLMFVLPALSIALWGEALRPIAWCLVGARVLVLLYAVAQLWGRLAVRTGVRLADVRPLFAYGGWVTASGVISPLMVYGDRFFVSMNLGAEILPVYAIPQEGLGRLLVIPAALAGALMPRMARAEDAAALEETYRRYSARVAWIMLGVCSAAALLAFPVLSVWISRAFAEQAIAVVLVLCVGVWLNSIAQLPATLLHAVGKPKVTALLHAAELVAYCVLVVAFSRWFGIVGAAIAWSLRVAVDLVLLRRMVDGHFDGQRGKAQTCSSLQP